jgi:hypothetical protein
MLLTDKRAIPRAFLDVVPRAGIEPAWCYHRGILNPLRLPVSPPGHSLEAEAGIEPAYTALQAAA